ncbi:twin-arginine translocation signal domain-containing protein [haloarchaeon 3A1-DGR]|nr:twin-arginine translocation signal domain-containing protein [haloarchaeon 3A1-DGR]
MSKSNSGSDAQATNFPSGPTGPSAPAVSRRTFMKGIGAAAAASVVGAGTVSAQAALNFESGLVQAPYLEGTVTVETVHVGGTTRDGEDDIDSMGVLDYIADDGSLASLKDAGTVIAPREDESTPHNPVTLRADRIDAEDFRSFPRGETYDEDGDGDAETDVSALDATHWTTDASGSTGTIDVTDADDALSVVVSGQASGDVATATFTDFSIGDGEQRKYLQLVANVNSLPSGTSATLSVIDEDGDAKAFDIDPSADPDANTTIATATGSGQVFQVQLGEISTSGSGDGTFANIEKVELSVSDADLDVELHALNLDRETQWSFGTNEYTNSDDELETQTLHEPNGEFSIVGIDDVSVPLAEATLRNVTSDVRVEASEIPADDVNSEFSDASDYGGYSDLHETIFGFDLPSAYEISWAISSMMDEIRFHSGDRYLSAEFATGLDEVPTVEDVEDIDWTDRRSTYADGSKGDEVSVSSTVSASEIAAVHFEVLLESGEKGSIESVPMGGPTGREGGGLLSTIMGPVGALLSAIGGIGLFKYFRGGA